MTTAGRSGLPGPARSRVRVGIALAGVIAIGLASRVYGRAFPFAVPKEFGDVLWGWMFFLWVVLIVPRVRGRWAGAAALAVTGAIEFLKLFRAPWLERVRADRVGGLLLGHVFLWHDLACYGLGVGVALATDRLLRRP